MVFSGTTPNGRHRSSN